MKSRHVHATVRYACRVAFEHDAFGVIRMTRALTALGRRGRAVQCVYSLAADFELPSSPLPHDQPDFRDIHAKCLMISISLSLNALLNFSFLNAKYDFIIV
eukprot:3891150-Pleurochrysis_carterae.AAC.5